MGHVLEQRLDCLQACARALALAWGRENGPGSGTTVKQQPKGAGAAQLAVITPP